jgi:catechol 2,3-dioxygenase-like lactoylglutathione lyase family enzyme
MASIQGFNHVGLCVTDVQQSATWYEKVFDVKRMMEDKTDQYEFALLIIGTAVLGLSTKAPDAKDAFTEFRTGLDHVGFGAASKADVEEWASRLDSLGVTNSGVISDQFGHHLNFRDPDNIALEIFAMP